MTIFRDLCILLGIPAFGILCFWLGRSTQKEIDNDPWHKFK